MCIPFRAARYMTAATFAGGCSRQALWPAAARRAGIAVTAVLLGYFE
jgi:hypothetical protein